MYICSYLLCNSICRADSSIFAPLITLLVREKVMANSGKVLVLGATGGIGGEVARQLRDAGWEVHALRRAADQPIEQKNGITWVRGDAFRREDVVAAAKGCSVIVHAVSPPGYRRWSELVLPMLDNTIAAATAERATVVLPGTVYNFGPDAFALVTEESRQNPVTRKGAIRVEMERRLEAFSAARGRVLIVRAGDFFGPQAGNNWFAQGLVKPGLPVAKISYPGSPGVGHQWAYVPDVARTIVELLARRDSLARFATFHMKGHWDHDGAQMPRAIQQVVARRTGVEPTVARFPWWFIRVAAPFVTTFREMLELRYLWRVPLRMDNVRLTAVLGAEPHTPLHQAIETTLIGLGCLHPSESPASEHRLLGR
jgi:nucleoside-diphosphate-sugar epimerase